MRERIRRIAGCLYVSRSASVPWAFIIALLAVFVLGSAAYAQTPAPAPGQIGQPDPAVTHIQSHQPERDRVAMQQRRPRRRIEEAEQREGLAERLEQLFGETREIEVRLGEMDEAMGDDRHDLEARLAELRVQIEMIQQRLAPPERIERPERQRERPFRRRRPEPEGRIEELNRHREELAEQARHREMELEELGQHMENRQQDIHNELRSIHEEMEELMRRREELAERAHQREMEMEELRENTERRQHEVHAELREIHEQMRGVEEALAQIERERQEHRRRLLDDVRGQTEKLRDHLRALHERAEHLQRALDELGDADGEAMELRRALAETREQIRQIERQLGRRQGPMPRPPKRWPMGPPTPPTRPDDRCDKALEQIEQTRLVLEQMQEAEGEAMAALREEIQALREATLETRKQLQSLILFDHPNTVGSAGQHYYLYYPAY